MTAIRIAYVINSVEGGGAALPVPSIARVLRDAGAEMTILALMSRDGRAIAPMEAAGLNVHVRAGGGMDDHVAALRWLDREIVRIAPTHIWTSLTRATLLGQLVGLRRRLPVVSWQHAAYLKPGNRRLLRLMQPLSKLWIGDSDAVTKLTAERLKVPAARLAQWSIFRADPGALQAKPWQPGEALRLGSLGRLHPVKGYDVLIDALALLPAWLPAHELTIFGEGGARAALEGRIAAHALTNVRLVGYAEDPAHALAGLHLYIQPSRSEGLCVAAHEAMQAGLPVIASAVGQLPHSITERVSGLTVPPADPQALADALATLIMQPDRLAKMGQAARTTVLDRFGPERFEAAGLAIVDRLKRL